MTKLSYDMRECPVSVVVDMCKKFHSYAGAGCLAVKAFAVYENGVPVAAYAWQPPPPGAAKAICPESPQGVLALSRMVAVPRGDRELNHVSKPLRRQMRVEIDRGRWPVLVTYSDESVGHTGHVYKCSGWEPTARNRVAIFEDESGRRTSSYSGGKTRSSQLKRVGHAWIQRWEHWICDRGDAMNFMHESGWERVPIPGKVWRSGNQAYTWENTANEPKQGSIF